MRECSRSKQEILEISEGGLCPSPIRPKSIDAGAPVVPLLLVIKLDSSATSTTIPWRK